MTNVVQGTSGEEIIPTNSNVNYNSPKLPAAVAQHRKYKENNFHYLQE